MMSSISPHSLLVPHQSLTLFFLSPSSTSSPYSLHFRRPSSHTPLRLTSSSSSSSSAAASTVSSDELIKSPGNVVENVVIIGSGPAGYTAAVYAARANLKPVVFEGYQIGGVPGGMRRQAERWGAVLDVKSSPFVVQSTDREVKCHSIIFATGATAKRLMLPREDEF